MPHDPVCPRTLYTLAWALCQASQCRFNYRFSIPLIPIATTGHLSLEPSASRFFAHSLLLSRCRSSGGRRITTRYVLGSAGLTDTGGRKAQADATIVNAGGRVHHRRPIKDRGYKAQIGYRFNRNFAVEGGYMDLGRYTYHADGTAPITATRDGKGPMDALNVVAVGSLPLTEQFSPIGKLGVAAQRMRFHCEGTGIACSNPDRTSRHEPAIRCRR